MLKIILLANSLKTLHEIFIFNLLAQNCNSCIYRESFSLINPFYMCINILYNCLQFTCPKFLLIVFILVTLMYHNSWTLLKHKVFICKLHVTVRTKSILMLIAQKVCKRKILVSQWCSSHVPNFFSSVHYVSFNTMYTCSKKK